MNDTTFRLISDFIQRENQREVEFHRDYHAYLVAEFGAVQPLVEYLDRYAKMGRLGQPLSEDVLARFAPTIPFPADLMDFYRRHGSVHGNVRQFEFTIYDLAQLDASRTPAAGKAHFESLGLLHMVDYVWGNSRDELQMGSETQCFTDEEIERLNSRYQVVAVWTDGRAFGEANYYIYYDETGRFGIAYMHQDDWDVEDLLETSGATYSWDEVIQVALKKMAADRAILDENET